MSAIYVGLFVSAEFDTGSGAAIAIIALIQFIAVGIGKMAWSSYNRTEPNSDVCPGRIRVNEPAEVQPDHS